MTAPEISIVVPAYNEEGRLEDSIDRIFRFFQMRNAPFEILVVDDGSTDATCRIALAAGERLGKNAVHTLRNSGNRGKGHSVRKGMLAARGRYSLITDADLSTPLEELARLEDAVIRGPVRLAFGSRDVVGSRVEVRQSWFRENAGKAFNRMVRLLTGLPYRDTQCGFKLFEMESCRAIFERQRIDRFAFDVEILYIARKWGIRMAEVPVVWRHREGSKVRMFPDAFWTFLDLFRIRWNDFRGRYEPPPALRISK